MFSTRGCSRETQKDLAIPGSEQRVSFASRRRRGRVLEEEPRIDANFIQRNLNPENLNAPYSNELHQRLRIESPSLIEKKVEILFFNLNLVKPVTVARSNTVIGKIVAEAGAYLQENALVVAKKIPQTMLCEDANEEYIPVYKASITFLRILDILNKLGSAYRAPFRKFSEIKGVINHQFKTIHSAAKVTLKIS